MQTDENVKRLHLAGQKEANAALALAMLLRLKEYAVRAYGLQPDRVRAFLTATAEKRRLVCATACCSSRPASCLYLCARIGQFQRKPFRYTMITLAESRYEDWVTCHGAGGQGERQLQRAGGVQPGAAAVGRCGPHAPGEAPPQGEHQSTVLKCSLHLLAFAQHMRCPV